MSKAFATAADRESMLTCTPDRASVYFSEVLLATLQQLVCLDSHARWGSPTNKDLAESIDQANLALLEVHNNLAGVNNW